MAGDDDDPVGIGRAALNRQDVHHLGRIGHAAAGDGVGGQGDGQATAAFGADGAELTFGPAAGRADAARLGPGFGQGVAGAEPDQGLDVGPHPVGLDLGGDAVQQRLLHCGGGLRLRRPRRQDQGKGGDGGEQGVFHGIRRFPVVRRRRRLRRR